MRILLLTPRVAAYGQDFLIISSAEAVGLQCVAAASAQVAFDPQRLRLLVTHDVYCPITSEYVIKQKWPRTPLVCHIHLQWHYQDAAMRQNSIRTLSRARIATAPAEMIRSEYAAMFPQVDWRLVRNGVDQHTYSPSSEAQRAHFRRKLGIGPQASLGIFVGRLDNAKGWQIIKKFSKLIAGSALHLLVQFPTFARNATEYQKKANTLHNEAPGHIHLFEDHDRTSDRPVRYCDWLLHPSLSECAPVTVTEALLCGIPSIATRSTTFYEELNDLGLPCRALVPIPDELKQMSLSTLALADSDTDLVAMHLFKMASSIVIPTDQERRLTAELARDSGFTTSAMVESYKAIYDEVDPPQRRRRRFTLSRM